MYYRLRSLHHYTPLERDRLNHYGLICYNAIVDLHALHSLHVYARKHAAQEALLRRKLLVFLDPSDMLKPAFQPCISLVNDNMGCVGGQARIVPAQLILLHSLRIPSRMEAPIMDASYQCHCYLSSWNGAASILGRRKAFPDRDDKERTRPCKTYSVSYLQNMRLFTLPFEIAYDTFGVSPTYISDSRHRNLL